MVLQPSICFLNHSLRIFSLTSNERFKLAIFSRFSTMLSTEIELESMYAVVNTTVLFQTSVVTFLRRELLLRIQTKANNIKKKKISGNTNHNMKLELIWTRRHNAMFLFEVSNLKGPYIFFKKIIISSLVINIFFFFLY